MHRIRPWLIGAFCATLLILSVQGASAAPGVGSRADRPSTDWMGFPSWLDNLVSALLPGWSHGTDHERSSSHQADPGIRSTTGRTGISYQSPYGAKAFATTDSTTESSIQIDPDG